MSCSVASISMGRIVGQTTLSGHAMAISALVKKAARGNLTALSKIMLFHVLLLTTFAVRE